MEPHAKRRQGASTRSRLSIAGAAIALYAASLATPALEFTHEGGGRTSVGGLNAALLGWQALLVGNLGWLANVFCWAGILLLVLGLVRISTIVGGLGVVAGLHTLMLFGTRLPVDEGGTRYMTLTDLRTGFYLWLGSVSTVMLGAAWMWWRRAATRSNRVSADSPRAGR